MILRILYALIRRQIFQYPSYVELQEHRQRVERAEELGVDVSTRFASMTFDVRDLWKLYRHVKPIKRNEMHKAKSASNISDVNQEVKPPDEDGRHLLDLKSDILHTLNLIADFHERVIKSAQLIDVRSYADCSPNSLFIWRDPVSSRSCCGVIFFLFLLTYFMPVQYLVKLLYFSFGLVFWHVVPIIEALPPADRARFVVNLPIFVHVLMSTRFPVPLASVPTDAEFAMQLISKRVADGNELRPAPTSRRSFEHSERGMHAGTSNDVQQTDIGNRFQTDNRIDWNKWGSRIATGKTWIHRKKQLVMAKEVLFWSCDYREEYTKVVLQDTAQPSLSAAGMLHCTSLVFHLIG